MIFERDNCFEVCLDTPATRDRPTFFARVFLAKTDFARFSRDWLLVIAASIVAFRQPVKVSR